MTEQTIWYRHYNEVKNEDALKRYVAQTYRIYDVLEGQLKKSSGEIVLETAIALCFSINMSDWISESTT